MRASTLLSRDTALRGLRRLALLVRPLCKTEGLAQGHIHSTQQDYIWYPGILKTISVLDIHMKRTIFKNVNSL